MRQLDTTVIALVGADADPWLGALGSLPNVRCLEPSEAGDPVERASLTWRQVVATRRRFTVHAADPLAGVADAWVEFFEHRGAHGDIEVARSQVLERWRSGTLDLPDYYLVVDPAGLGETRRHWYLGVLATCRPSRVVVVTGDEGAVLGGLRGLPAGPWWPDLDVLLDSVERTVPERAGPVTTR